MFRISIENARRLAVRLENEARIKRMLAQVDAMLIQVKALQGPPEDGSNRPLGPGTRMG